MNIKNLKISHKMIIMTSALIVIVSAVLMTVVMFQKVSLKKDFEEEMSNLVKNEATKITTDIYKMCSVYNEKVLEKLDSNLKVARMLMESKGEVDLDSKKISWAAVNQSTGQVTTLELPEFKVGNVSLGKNASASTFSPVVDDVNKVVGGICTIFQRMNSSGDMLRISTNIIAENGSRAIGIYIPAVDKDGKRNEIVSTVLRGEAYQGTSKVLGELYLAVYEPIWDKDRKEVVGILCVAEPQDSGGRLRKSIIETIVGETGYVYVLGTQGENRGRYIISSGGKRDGENIWDATDANGNYLIRETVENAENLKPGEIAYQVYDWKNQGDTDARTKIVAYSYFGPWDWVIGSGAYVDDFQDSIQKLTGSLNAMVVVFAVISAIAVVLSILLALWLVASQITKPLKKIQLAAEDISRGDLSCEVEHDRGDEIGMLSRSFVKLIDSQKEKANVAETIAHGDLSIRYEESSAKDTLGKAMVKMLDSLKRKADVAESIAAGNLDIEVELASDKDTLGHAMQSMVSSIDRVNEDIASLTEAALVGNLEKRADLAVHKGDYAVLIGSINKLMETIVEPIMEASDILMKAADKDMTARVTGNYKGQFDQLKQNINTTVEALEGALLQVNRSAEQVSAASNEISSGSQQLAEGANEQASSIEEISASLEEIASMTRQNSDNAKQAKSLSGEAREAADTGIETMGRMNDSIEKLKNSSDETAKILKTIDEIAFQTNLLALNAAVEAARAGEAGKGFAVVAEEVRNLAQRSAEAAKNTGALIENAIQNSNECVVISGEVASSLEKIVQGARKTNDLVSEIAAAANEQTSGVDQVTIAVNQLDKVVQMNASNSEESASAAEELNGQATELRQMIAEFKLNQSQVSTAQRLAPAGRHHVPAQRKLARPRPNGRNEEVFGSIIKLEDSDF